MEQGQLDTGDLKERGVNCVCQVGRFKYRCPECLNRICSLNCYQKHKKYFQCKGSYSYTKKIKKGDMGTQQMRRDIKFLSTAINDSGQILKKLSSIESMV